MQKSLIFGSLAAVLLAGSAQAQDDDAATAQANAQTASASTEQAEGVESEQPDRGQEVVCRRERVTGSRTRVYRICKTRDEWNGVYDNTRDAHNDAIRSASGSSVYCSDPQRVSC